MYLYICQAKMLHQEKKENQINNDWKAWNGKSRGGSVESKFSKTRELSTQGFKKNSELFILQLSVWWGWYTCPYIDI